MLLIGMNLKATLSPKHQERTICIARLALLMQIRCRFNAHFNCLQDYGYMTISTEMTTLFKVFTNIILILVPLAI